GLFSAGIMDVLMEEGITFDGLIGVSAGAAFGCNYKSGQAGRAIRYNTAFARDKRYCSWRSFFLTGDLYGAKFAYHDMPERYDLFDNEAFERSPMEFYVVCTDVVTGKPVYQKIMKGGHDTYDWIRASASMPVVSRIVELDGYKLLDGGMADSIPLKFFQNEGFGHNVVVLTQAADYRKTPNRLMPIIRFSLRKYPAIVETMERRHLMYNEELDYVASEEKKGHTLVIRPDEPLPIGHVSHDPEEMKRVYQIGRDKATTMLDEIKRFLNI
nr:patatin family protein [Prevotella sp.]